MSEQMREEFEAWASKNGISIVRCSQALMFANGSRRAVGDYIATESLCAWEAWLAKPDGALTDEGTIPEHPLITTLHDNGDLIAAQATIAQQAQMIEHLRGGPTPGYTAVDMTTAAAQGFRDGVASVVVELPPPYPMPEEPEEAIDDSFMDVYHAANGMRHACEKAIIAAGGRIKE
jgi:hypothetical protein